MKDKNCYVCQKDILKKYICKECYYKLYKKNLMLINYIDDELYCYLPEPVQNQWDNFKKEINK